MVDNSINKTKRNQKKNSAENAQFSHMPCEVSDELFRKEEPDNPLNKYGDTYPDKNQPHMIKNKHINRVHNFFTLSQFVRTGKFFLLLIIVLNISEVIAKEENLQRGYALFQEGKYTEALCYFREAVEGYPLLSCYGLFYLAVCYERSGKVEGALKTYQKFLALHPQHRLAPTASFRVARLLSENSRHAEAITIYHRLIEDPSFFALDRLYFLLAEEYFHLEKWTPALIFYRKLISNFPQSQWALASLEKSKKIKAKLAIQPAAVEKYEDARVLKYHKEYELALALLRGISAEETTLAADAQMLIGNIYSDMGGHNRAIEEYEKLLSRFPYSDLRHRAIYGIAEGFYVLGDLERAFENYERLIANYPDSWLVDDSLKRQGELLEEKGKPSCAVSKYKLILGEHCNEGLLTEASYRIAYHFMKKGDFSRAANFFATIFYHYPRSSLAPEAMYWFGRCQEKMENYSEAIKTYQMLMRSFPYHFYRFQAEHRITQLNEKLSGEVIIDEDALSPVSGGVEMFSQMKLCEDASINFRKGVALIKAGMYEDAIGEIRLSPIERDQNFFFNLAALSAEAGDYRRSIMWMEIASKRWDILYKELLFYLYPRHFREYVEFYARQFEIDPFLIWAIIREESRFDPRAVSASDARGLMQFIPSTGRWVAEKLNIHFSPFDPSVSIRMGAWYINHLLEVFDENVVFAIAAYNGGQGRVRKWVERGGFSSMDEFIKTIPRQETRTFVKRVLGSYNTYRWLYSVRKDE